MRRITLVWLGLLLVTYLGACCGDMRSPRVMDVIVMPPEATLEVGETLTLWAVVMPAGANPNVAWSSDDPFVASVSATGVVTAENVGSVLIRARSREDPARVGSMTLSVEAALDAAR